MAYRVGESPRYSVDWKDLAGAAVDPTGQTLQLRAPSGDLTTYTYGTDLEYVRSALGSFYVDGDAVTEQGVWHGRWQATGALEAVKEFRFYVDKSGI